MAKAVWIGSLDDYTNQGTYVIVGLVKYWNKLLVW